MELPEKYESEFWERVNEATKDTVTSIVMDMVYKRAAATQIASRIIKRCESAREITLADQQALIKQLEKRLAKIPTGQVCPKCGEIFETALGGKGLLKISDTLNVATQTLDVALAAAAKKMEKENANP